MSKNNYQKNILKNISVNKKIVREFLPKKSKEIVRKKSFKKISDKFKNSVKKILAKKNCQEKLYLSKRISAKKYPKKICQKF